MIKYNLIFIFGVAHIFAIYGLNLFYKKFSYNLLFQFFFTQQVVSMMGITIGAHRLWSHKSFKATTLLRIMLMIANSICNQGSIYWWCRDHIMHHKYTDTDGDPYNAKRGLFFSHMGWLFLPKHKDIIEKSKSHNFDFLLEDPVVKFQYLLDPWFSIFCSFGLPTLYGKYMFNDYHIGFFIFGVLRWLFTLHCTWTVNSLAHYTGTREFDQNSTASNNWLVAVLAVGEGWHNFHHKFPNDYTNSDKSMLIQYNPSSFLIDLFAFFGMAYDRKIAKINDNSKYLLKLILPYVNSRDIKESGYELIINDKRALRTWLYEYSDPIEGLNVVYKHKLIEVNGCFNNLNYDVLRSICHKKSLLTKIYVAIQLHNYDKISIT